MFKFYCKMSAWCLYLVLLAQSKAVEKARKIIATNEERIGFLEAQRIELENENDKMVDWLQKNHAVL